MPDFEITSPDGKKFIVTAPEGAKPDEVLSYAQKQFSAAPAKPALDPNASSTLGSMARGVVRGATMGFADELRAGTDALAQGAGNLFSSGGPSMGEAYDASLAASRKQNAADDAAHPVAAIGGQMAGGVGGVLLTAPAAGAALGARVLAPVVGRVNALMGQAPAGLRTAAQYVGGGAAGGAVTGFGEGESGAGARLGNAGEGAAYGAAGGAAIGAGASAVGRLISPVRSRLTAEGQGLVDAATREGIPLSPGQETGSRALKGMEAALTQLPGSSGAEQAFAEAQRRAFNGAVLRRAGENADIASPEVLTAARERIGGQIGEIANRNTLQATPELAARLTDIEDGLRFLPNEAAAPIRARLEQIRGMTIEAPAGSGGTATIPGASYRMLDSQIGRTMRGTSNGDLRAALGDIRTTLREAMDTSIGPEDAAAWQQARREYANLMVAADAAKGAGGAAAEGNISPLALRGALDRSTGGGYVWGRGDLNELARVGQGVLREPPDSGTAGRTSWNNMLTGSLPAAGAGVGFGLGGPVGAAVGAAAPFVIPRAVQAVYRSTPARAYLTNRLMDRLEPPAGAAAIGSGGVTARERRQD